MNRLFLYLAWLLVLRPLVAIDRAIHRTRQCIRRGAGLPPLPPYRSPHP